MIYAYVTSESCIKRNAVKRGEWVGDRPVSRHGDYEPWNYGKRETRQLADGTHPLLTKTSSRGVYLILSARSVLRCMGW